MYVCMCFVSTCVMFSGTALRAWRTAPVHHRFPWENQARRGKKFTKTLCLLEEIHQISLSSGRNSPNLSVSWKKFTKSLCLLEEIHQISLSSGRNSPNVSICSPLFTKHSDVMPQGWQYFDAFFTSQITL